MQRLMGVLGLSVLAILPSVACLAQGAAPFGPAPGDAVAAPSAKEPMSGTPSHAPEPSSTAPPAEPELPVPELPGPTADSRSDGSVVLTVVLDNHAADPRLETAWGFSCLVETAEGVVLFDTGGDGRMLLSNLAALDIDPAGIDAVVLSHIHDDHVGGLDALLGANDHLVVYLPHSFPPGFAARVADRARVVEVAGPLEVFPGVRSTGQMGTATVEQALMVDTPQGLVVLTGCAHPGVAQMVNLAREFGPVHLVMGGFHLGEASPAEVERVIGQFQELGVEKVAPCHCTGEGAIAAFAEAYGSAHLQAGAGTVVSIEG